MVRRIEQAIGQKIPVGELPKTWLLSREKKQEEVEEKKPVKNKQLPPVAGEAFHQKNREFKNL